MENLERAIFEDMSDANAQYLHKRLRLFGALSEEDKQFAIDDLVRESWEGVHSGYYKDVSGSRRAAFRRASVYMRMHPSSTLEAEFHRCRGVILCGCADEDTIAPVKPPARTMSECPERNLHWDLSVSSGGTCSVIQYSADLSLVEFQHATSLNKPFVVRGLCSHWDATEKWRCPQYWLHNFAEVFVPVEIGGYLSADFEQALVSMADYVHYICDPGSGPRVYLAQYNIFSLIPRLAYDVSPLPDHICMMGDVLSRNIFFGPIGTVSPLHTDPHDNLLCQVFGTKYVRLHDPLDSQFLYPTGGRLTGNSTDLPDDLTVWDDETSHTFPLYHQARQYETILRGGDCLYIPRGWWHFVKSESPSASMATFCSTEPPVTSSPSIR